MNHCERGTGAAPADGPEEADQMERRLASVSPSRRDGEAGPGSELPGGSELFSGSKEPLPRQVTNDALHCKNKILPETERKLFGAMILQEARLYP